MPDLPANISGGEINMLDHYKTDLREYLARKVHLHHGLHKAWPTGLTITENEFKIDPKRKAEVQAVFAEVLRSAQEAEVPPAPPGGT